MKTRYIKALAALAAMLIFLYCNKPIDVGGGTSENGNAMIVGKLVYTTGAPAINAVVHLRKKTVLGDTALAKTFADTAATVTTNDTGGFSIDSIDPGLYVIEGAKDSDVVLIDSVAVTSQDSTVTLPPDTLKPAGALKGIIYLSEGGDPRKVFILAFGIDRFAGVNTDGSFKFSNLAEGKYDLRIISSLDNYGVLDTFGISVISADTANLDTIRLPFIGIPTPKNVSIVYDTLRQIVTLTWAKADTALAKTYNVYRRNVELNTVLARINTSPIVDTVYRDSTGAQDSTYEYVVAAVSPANMEGTMSAVISVKVVSGFVWIDTIGTGHLTFPGEFKIDNKNRIIIPNIDPNTGNHNVVIFDSTFNFVTSFGEGLLSFPASIELDSLNNIYVGAQNGVFKFDSSGVILDTIFRTASGFTMPYLSILDSFLYVSNGGTGNIMKYSLNGDSITTWGGIGNLNGQFVGGSNVGILAFNNEVFVCDQQSRKIHIFDLLGTFTSAWSAPFSSYPFAQPIRISLDSKNNYYVALQSPNSVLIFSPQRQYMGKIVFENPVPDIKGTIVISNKVFIAMGNVIRVYRMPNF